MLERLKRSTVARITATYLVLLIAIASALGAYVYWRVNEQMWHQLEQHIASEVEGLAEQFRVRGLAGMLRIIDERLARIPDRRSIYLVEDRFGTWLIGNITEWPTAPGDANGWITFELYDRAAGQMTQARVQTFRLPSGARLLVGRDTADIHQTTALIRQALLWGIAFAVVLAGLLAVLFSRRAWARLQEINETSRKVVAGDLQVRVPDRGKSSDLDELSRNMNSMLEEINRLMAGVERVSDNIAHDLRTPLARVRNRLNSMTKTADPASRRDIDNCLKEVDELIDSFNAILRIARLSHQEKSANKSHCDLREVVASCVELYSPLAEKEGLSITFHGASADLFADEQLLKQAICNILDNAIKFSHRGGRISLAINSEAGQHRLLIADQGTGIPAAEREKVLERFYRGDGARQTKGSGLGLSMVKAIADHHQARLILDDNRPGLKVILEFPRAISPLFPSQEAA